MSSRNSRRARHHRHVASRFAVFACAATLSLSLCARPALSAPFTVSTEIGLAHFGDPYTGKGESIEVSPDQAYLAVQTERGRLDLNRLEDSIRIYRSKDVAQFLKGGRPEAPAPLWSVSQSTSSVGPIISHWRWLSDSSGVAFLERLDNGHNRLVLADLRSRAIEPLTGDEQDVAAFDIRDRTHYVYAVIDDAGLREQARSERQASAIGVTGRALPGLLFPYDRYPQVNAPWVDRSTLWAKAGSAPAFRVRDASDGQPVLLFSEGEHTLALSPDAKYVIAATPLADIPVGWESLYPPGFPSDAYRLHPGPQDLTSYSGARLASRYVRVELATGRSEPLVNAPTALSSGWPVVSAPVWSKDGAAVLLPGTFLAAAKEPTAPCVAYVNISRREVTCIEALKGFSSDGRDPVPRIIAGVDFDGLASRQVVLRYYNPDVGDTSEGTQSATVYRQRDEGGWVPVAHRSHVDRLQAGPLELEIRQDFNEPPVLEATDTRTRVSKVLWDPNPQLAQVDLGKAVVYRWKDASGRDWSGGLYGPPGGFTKGTRYPLVIQTHGFANTLFRPSGIFPTAFAARALAAAGIAVLQVQDCSILTTPEEGPCNVAGYRSAIQRLTADGIADPQRVGIVGFSRTCFYVMEALTAADMRLQAASITDGVMEDYLQYLFAVDQFDDMIGREAEAMNAASPFGEGMQQWLKRSPTFRLDQVRTPLMVVGEGPISLLFMWAPYAGLRYLNKPVDLVLLNSGEHVLTNPAVRLASQGGSVDWFRFWLQGYEDSDPGKATQYRRWERLCETQAMQNPHAPRWCAQRQTR